MTFRANSEVVAVAWLKGVAGIDPDFVGTTVPQRNNATTGTWSWATTGFVQMVAVTGGTPGLHVPQREAVVQVDFWAVNPDSGLPPWGKARDLAELVIADCYRTANGTEGNRDVSNLMPTGYADAYVQSAYPLSEPRRLPGDAGYFARLTMDLSLVWVEL